MSKIYLLLFLLPLFLINNSSAQDVTHVAAGSVWKYNTGTSLGTTWINLSYNDAAWSQGAAQLGYGDGDEATVIPSGPAGNYNPTYYFRKTFTANPLLLADLKLRVKRDDGVVIYLNGLEVYRNNMPAGVPAYTTWASAAASDDGATWLTATLSAGSLIQGTNVVAVEIHQSGATSSDVSFDMELTSQPKSMVAAGGVWKYSTGADLGTTWISSVYNDAAWSSGAAELGYGDGDEATVIPSGPLNNYNPTYYFRKAFSVTDATAFAGYTLRVKRDDGVIVYINGTEVYRNNMPSGTPAYNSWASTACSDDGTTWFNASIPSSVVASGNNIIAVEIHQAAATSTDVSFNLELSGVTTLLLSQGINWKYSTGTDLGTAWKASVYNDAAWSAGPSELGYGDGDEETVIPSGTSPNFYPTYYFRNSFTVDNTALFTGYTLRVRRDDGVVVYINGTEVYRDNMPAGTPTYSTWATAAASDDGATWLSTSLSAASFVSGTNVIAVEVHQSSATSTDVTFNLDITGTTGLASLTRGPYLQLGTPTSMIVRWRTNSATDSKVNYGLTPGSLTQTATDNTSTTEHIVQLTGLTANTKYYYSIGSTSQTLQGDTTNFFYTSPLTGTEKLTRIWATGDCGSGATLQANVRNAYENFMGGKYTDVWLLLGDNAYNGGYDNEFQLGFFEPYMLGKVMRQSVIWPAPGNHDYDNSAALLANRATPYYQSFTMPAAAQAGGVASGTEAYYSYNYGNIHFISLDSYGTEAGMKMYDTTGAQAVWLKQDLAANTQKWTIAYWHHPPYTKGSHNSDTESDLVAVRNNIIRILDRYKVDLVLCGHSHLYERSKIQKGHYGLESTFSGATHNHSSSSALYDGSANSCPYVKSSTATANEGIIYVVAGSAGKLSGTTTGYPHNAMYYSNNTVGGSLLLEVDGNRLDAKFISEAGAVLDKFTVMKDVNKNISQTIASGQSITLNASWKGNYLWNPTSLTTPSITQSPLCSSVYIVVDSALNCLRDTFNVTVTGATPLAQFNIPATICAGVQTSFTDQSTNTPSTWSWSFADGNPSTSTSQHPSVTFATSGTKAVSLTVTNCFGSNSTTQNVTVNPVITPAVSLAITSGSQTICAGTSVTFTATPTNGGSSPSYNFQVNSTSVQNGSIATFASTSLANGDIVSCVMTASPVCASSTVANSNSISMTVTQAPSWYLDADNDNYYTGNAITQCSSPGANYKTTGLAGDCNDSNPAINPGVSEICGNSIDENCDGTADNGCSSPILISGTVSNTVCAGTSNGAIDISVSGGTSPYNWIWSNGALTEDISGLSAGNYSVTVTDNSSTSTSAAFVVGTNSQVPPSVPGSITGPLNAVCKGSTQTYSIAAVAGATGYNWVATGSTIVSGQGTTSIVVSFSNNYTTATIKVQSLGTCSSSAYNSPISIRSTPVLESITGELYGHCGSTGGVKYSVPLIPSATTYRWTASSRMTITAGQGSNIITVQFSSGFSFGTIKVYATNACGNSNTISATIKAVPQAPVAISGSAAVCPTTANTYTIASVPSATSYTWTVPSGWTVLSGQGTTTLSVQSGTTAGTLKVAAVNACGAGASISKTVTIATCKDGSSALASTEDRTSDANSFVIFPNPAEEEVNLSYSFAEAGAVAILFYDLNGKLIYHDIANYTEPRTVYQKRIATNNLPGGIYMVRVSCNQYVMSERLVIAN